MGDLVKGSGGLVLGVAGLGQSGQSRKVKWARDHEGAGGESVSQNSTAAAAVDISAVLLGDTRGSRATLGSDAVEDGDKSARGRSRFEVLDNLSTVGGSGRGRELG